MRLTCLPFGPVCSVTRVEPSICSANSFTSSTDLAMRTPPLSPAFFSLNLPLPRPPAWICDLTAHTGPPSFVAASTASCTEKAGSPCATGTPYFARTCLAWYSWMFMRPSDFVGRAKERSDVPASHVDGGHASLCPPYRSRQSSLPQLRRDLVAGVDQRAHRRDRLVEHLALGA